MNTSSASEHGFVRVAASVDLPYAKEKAPLNLVVAHGLGSDPARKTHLNDISCHLWHDCAKILESEEEKKKKTAILYTARGHGASKGWEPTASSDEHAIAEAFTWSELSKDMQSVVSHFFGDDDGNVTIFGQSMGAATALYFAGREPNHVKALILARPPRMWRSRQDVKQGYIKSVERFKRERPNDFHYLPILGAWLSDLPPAHDPLYTSIFQIPVLILCHGNDAAHPIESGELLATALPQATLDTSCFNEDEARHKWPRLMADWIVAQGLVDRR